MTLLDPLTSYAVSGVGALLGGALLGLIRLDDKGLRSMLRRCSLALLLLLLGLSPARQLFTAPDPSLFVQGLTLVGTVASVPLIAASLGALSGLRSIRSNVMFAAALFMALVQALAMMLPGALPGVVYAVMASAGSGLLLLACWPLLARPRQFAEAALGACAAMYAFSWVPRLVGALTWEGPALPHHLYLPPEWWPFYGVLYAVLPGVVSTLVLSVAAMRLHLQLVARATTDELTGLLMRRALHENALEVLRAGRAAGSGTAVLVCDIDHFKRINDTQGHAQGDEVLRGVAHVLQAQLRAPALLARYGGEEFVAVLEARDVAVARQVAERLRAAVATMAMPGTDGRPLALSISIGVAMVTAGDTLEQALSRADEALYRAKHAGRNRVEVALAAA
jgi:diguanylate cyclase (GGDEF)-like protein